MKKLKLFLVSMFVIFSFVSCDENNVYHSRRVRRTDDVVEVYDKNGALLERHIGHIAINNIRKDKTYDIRIYENGKDNYLDLSYSLGLVFVKVQRGELEYELVKGKANFYDDYFD